MTTDSPTIEQHHDYGRRLAGIHDELTRISTDVAKTTPKARAAIRQALRSLTLDTRAVLEELGRAQHGPHEITSHTYWPADRAAAPVRDDIRAELGAVTEEEKRLHEIQAELVRIGQALQGHYPRLSGKESRTKRGVFRAVDMCTDALDGLRENRLGQALL